MDLIESKNPAIIFVNPQMGENIGFAARSMLNFELTDLRIVSPVSKDFIEKALITAKSASSTISSIKIFDNLSESLADINYACAISARSRNLLKPTKTPKTAFNKISKQQQLKYAFIFGPENNGLSNKDLSLANEIITIPANKSYSSMNIAQAVSIICYEWYNLCFLKNFSSEYLETGSKIEIATKDELLNFFKDLESKLRSNNFFVNIPEKEEKMILNIRNIFSRHQITSQELRTFRGIINNISKK